jgi:hypothetical protein
MVIAQQASLVPNLNGGLRAATQPSHQLISGKVTCTSCGGSHAAGAKFCTGCGEPKSNVVQPVRTQVAPVFSHLHSTQQARGVPKELQEELGKLMVAIARERLFLYFHWLCFLAFHFSGFMLAYNMYQDFAGDEASKIIVCLPSLFFLNLTAFFILPLIKSTRFMIARLKEQLTYIHYRIEYRDLW